MRALAAASFAQAPELDSLLLPLPLSVLHAREGGRLSRSCLLQIQAGTKIESTSIDGIPHLPAGTALETTTLVR